MILILKRIPENTKSSEIVDYFAPIVKGKIFQKTGHINHVKMLVSKDSNTYSTEFHALVYIEPDEVAHRVIKKFNRKVFKGKNIAVIEYKNRSWHNDRRIKSLTTPQKNQRFKREFDRRESELKEKGIRLVNFSSQNSFHHKL